MEIYFGAKTLFLGRNGEFSCVGLKLSHNRTKTKVLIQPITSKMKTARAKLEIPTLDIPKFIESLKEFQ